MSKFSIGLCTSFNVREETCVYICVVDICLCPSSSWINLVSVPLSNKCVAKLWRNVWGVAFFINATFLFMPFHECLNRISRIAATALALKQVLFRLILFYIFSKKPQNFF